MEDSLYGENVEWGVQTHGQLRVWVKNDMNQTFKPIKAKLVYYTFSRAVLSIVVATGHTWLYKFNFDKTENHLLSSSAW